MRRSLHRALRIAERFLAALGVAWLCQTYVLEVSLTTTSCMAPLLVGRDRAGDRADWVVVSRLTGAKRVPARRFAVVSLEDDEGFPIVKRVVGFPGETLVLRRDRTLFVDGVRIPAPPGVGQAHGEGLRGYLPFGNLGDETAFHVPEGHVYVLGDDTGDAQDSRFVGAIPVSKIRGRVVLVFRRWDRLDSL